MDGVSKNNPDLMKAALDRLRGYSWGDEWVNPDQGGYIRPTLTGPKRDVPLDIPAVTPAPTLNPNSAPAPATAPSLMSPAPAANVLPPPSVMQGLSRKAISR